MTVFVDFLESKTSRLMLIPIDLIVEIGRAKDGGVYINCEGLETMYCNWSIDEFHKQIKDRRDESLAGAKCGSA